jgi:hypothetical protein
MHVRNTALNRVAAYDSFLMISILICLGRKGMHVGFWWESRRKETTTKRANRKLEDNVKIDLRDIE